MHPIQQDRIAIERIDSEEYLNWFNNSHIPHDCIFPIQQSEKRFISYEIQCPKTQFPTERASRDKMGAPLLKTLSLYSSSC